MHTTTAAAAEQLNFKVQTKMLLNAVVYMQSSLRHYLYILTPAKQTLNGEEHCAPQTRHHTYFIERFLKDTLGVIEATLRHVAGCLAVQ